MIRSTDSRIPRVIVVPLSGCLELGEPTRRLREEVRELIAREMTVIVLDMKRVTGIDPSACSTLIDLFAAARNVGVNLKLANLPESVDIPTLVKLWVVFDRILGRRTTDPSPPGGFVRRGIITYSSESDWESIWYDDDRDGQ
jgi:anti-anti-sigma regulatory factor